MNFIEAVNKMLNGKVVNRPGFTNNICIMMIPNSHNLYKCYPNNNENPCILYSPTSDDVIATDWELN